VIADRISAKALRDTDEGLGLRAVLKVLRNLTDGLPRPPQLKMAQAMGRMEIL
jgi:hypothetical protein